MLHWIDFGIVYLCYHGSSSCCIWLIVTLLICFLSTLPHVVFDWLWYCLSVFSWFSSCCIVLIVTVFICVLMVLPHVALDWLWHCLSVFQWFFLMVRSYFALDWLWYCFSVFLCFYLIIHWIDCGIVYLCSHGSSSCCIGLIVKLFICVLMVFPHVALDWLRYCLPVFSWFFLMLPWIDCDIVFLCFHGSASCCFWFIVTLFIFVLVVLPHVALDSLLHCLSVFLWFYLMLHWIDWGIVYLCSRGSSSCCIGLIVALFICVLMVLPHVALNWLWHCLSVFLWFFLMLHWIDCDIV